MKMSIPVLTLFAFVLSGCLIDNNDYYLDDNLNRSIELVNFSPEGYYFRPDFIQFSFTYSDLEGKNRMDVFLPKRKSKSSFVLDLNEIVHRHSNDFDMFDIPYNDNIFIVYTDQAGNKDFFSKNEFSSEASYSSVLSTSNSWNNSLKSNCTCYYWDTYVNGQLVSSEFLGCSCPCEDPTIAITCGGGGGGGTTNVNLDDSPPDCESFPFSINSSYTNRISGVHNLYFHYASYEWFGDAAAFEFEWHQYNFENIIYFTAPLYLQNSEAANLTAQAISAVNARLENAFGHDGWGSNAGAVENFIMNALNDEMSSWGGSAGFNSNGATGSQIGLYNETWLPTTCN